MAYDTVKVLNDLVNSEYFSKLSTVDKKAKWEMLKGWIEKKGLDNELLVYYSKTKVAKLDSQLNIKNMLELSLHLKKLFHYEEFKDNPMLFSSGICYYDSIFDNFFLDNKLK